MTRVLAVLLIFASVNGQAECSEQRLLALKTKLQSEHDRTHTWSIGWGIAYTGLTMAQIIPVAFLTEQGDRVDLSLGALSALVGVVLTLALPPDVPDTSGLPEETCAAQAEVERRIAHGAAEQASGTSWLMHLGGVAINLAFSAVLAFGLKHYVSAVVNFVVGEAITEATFLTQPTGLVGALEVPGTDVHVSLLPAVSQNSLGVRLVGAF